MVITTIDSDILAKIHERIPPTFTQAHRLIDYLADRPHSITVDINQACAIGNISDVAHKINYYLWDFGLFISCSYPNPPVPNRFGERSRMFRWSVYKVLTEAANDAPKKRAGVQSC